jgi:hypothetical protein
MTWSLIIGLALAALMIVVSVWLKLRKKRNFIINPGFESGKEWGSYMTFKVNRGAACLLKDHTGLFGYAAPYKSDTETSTGVHQSTDEAFYFRTKHGKKATIYFSYGEPIPESRLKDLELNDSSAITPVWVKWEGR